MATKVYIAANPDGTVYVAATAQGVQHLTRSLKKDNCMLIGSWDVYSPSAADLCLRSATQRLKRNGFEQDGDGSWSKAARAMLCDIVASFYHWLVDESEKPTQQLVKAICAIRVDLLDVSQFAFGQICGADASAVSRWESGQIEPSWYHLNRLREFCGQFFGDELLEDRDLFWPLKAREAKARRKQHG
jgi:hypothetical protein